MSARGVAFATLFLLGAATCPARADWQASGSFFYRDREQDIEGFTGTEPDRPARRVDVQIVDATTSFVLATGATDNNGYFSFLVPDGQVRNVRVRMVSLSTATPGLLVDVRNNQSARIAYAVTGPTFNGHIPTAQLDFGATTALPGTGGEAFNVFDVLVNGFDFFATLEGGALPNVRVTAFWEPGSLDGTYFRASDNSIHLRGGKGYDDTVVGHEQGHFISRNWSKDQNPGGTHFIGDNYQDLRLSWSEGFATFFAGAARRAFGLGPRASDYIDTDGSPGSGNLNFSFEFETPSAPANGAASEVSVSAALWDIIDDGATPDPTPGFDDDLLGGHLPDLWEVFRNYLPQAQAQFTSLEDFWDGWFRPGFNHGFPGEMQSAFDALDIRYYPDGGEPDNSFAQARNVASNGTAALRTTYPAADIDYFRFGTSAGKSYIVETTDLLSASNTSLQVYAGDETTLLGSSEDRSPFDRSSRVQFTATASGFGYARVTQAVDVGVYGSYSLRVLEGAAGSAVFTNVASAQGVAHTGNARGTAWGDVNADGRPDLFVTNIGGPGALFRNNGGTFTDRAVAWGAAGVIDTEGAAFCDYDKDGDLDLFLTALGPVALLRNMRSETGDSVFVNATAAAGVTRSLDGRSAAWGDADRDGFADLYVTDAAGAPVLFKNLGNGTFADITAPAGVSAPGASISAAWCDYDRDGDDDLFVVINAGSSRLYQNRLRDTGALTFVDVTDAAGVPGGSAGFACDWGDFDDDGLQDLYLADAGGPNFLYRNQGDGTFTDVALARNAAAPLTSTSAAWGDYDNDGDLDLFVSTLAQPGLPGYNQLLESVSGHFTTIPELALALPTRSATWVDFDGDLDLDLHLANANGVADQLLRNGTTQHNALAVTLLGRASNRDGYGATVRIKAAGRGQHRLVSGGSGFGSQSSVAVEFGLGAAASAESLVVDWPSGMRSILVSLAPGAYLVDEASAVGVGPPGAVAFAAAFDGASPNPVRGRASLAFVAPGAAGGAGSRIVLALYSVAGRKVRTLVDQSFAPGPAHAAFDGTDDSGARLAPGVYLVRMSTEHGEASGKLVLLP